MLLTDVSYGLRSDNSAAQCSDVVKISVFVVLMVLV